MGIEWGMRWGIGFEWGDVTWSRDEHALSVMNIRCEKAWHVLYKYSGISCFII